jgi:streptogramin lyase
MFLLDGLRRAGSARTGDEKQAVFTRANRITSLARACLGVIVAGLLVICAGRCGATSITEFSITPGYPTQPFGIVQGPDGRFWFTEFYANGIGSISTNATTSATTVTNILLPTSGAKPFGITVGTDSNIWFTEFDGAKIGCMNTNGTLLGEFPVPTPASRPMGIVSGPGGFLWFVERDGSKVCVMTNHQAFASNTVVTNAGFLEIRTPTSNCYPCNLTVGPDNNIWFTEAASGVGQIARLNVNAAPIPLLTSSNIQEFTLSDSNCQPFGITVGPDNALWFTEYVDNRIGRMETNGITTNEYALPTAGAPYGITAGRDGSLWFAESSVSQIGRITPNGTNTNAVIAEFVIPSLSSGVASFPALMATGSDGNIWFTENNGDSIGKITDSPITVNVLATQLTNGTVFSNYVAYFQDTDPTNGPVTAYTAAIKWGDGAVSSGTVTVSSSPPYFDVSGTHTYTTPALYEVVVTVTDSDTSHDMGGGIFSGTNSFTVTSSNGLPTLSIQQLGTNVVISWPGSYPGFQLQVVTNLVKGVNNWINVSGTPVLVSSSANPGQMLYEVTNFINHPKVYYRLMK